MALVPFSFEFFTALDKNSNTTLIALRKILKSVNSLVMLRCAVFIYFLNCYCLFQNLDFDTIICKPKRYCTQYVKIV